MPRRMLLLTALAIAGCTSTPATPAPAPVPPSPAAVPVTVETPPLDSISLEPRETSRECDAGICTVRFDVVPSMDGPGGNDPRLTWRVTYRVLGGADGVTEGSFLMGRQRSETLPSETVTVEPGGRIALTVASIDLVPE